MFNGGTKDVTVRASSVDLVGELVGRRKDVLGCESYFLAFSSYIEPVGEGVHDRNGGITHESLLNRQQKAVALQQCKTHERNECCPQKVIRWKGPPTFSLSYSTSAGSFFN